MSMLSKKTKRELVTLATEREEKFDTLKAKYFTESSELSKTISTLQENNLNLLEKNKTLETIILEIKALVKSKNWFNLVFKIIPLIREMVKEFKKEENLD